MPSVGTRMWSEQEPTHRFVETNGIKMHVAEMGTGPAVLLLHGFPETWYTWRFQLKALAEAGFRAVAPDLRGYGLTECPKDSYGHFKMTPMDGVGDLVGLIHDLGEDSVFIVAHDAGSFPALFINMMRPDLVRGTAFLGAPLIPKLGMVMDEGFYPNRFAIPGRAEKDFSRFDTVTVLRKIYTLFCKSTLETASPDQEIMDLVKEDELEALPSWCNDEFLKLQAELYDNSGFEGPLWFTYRDNMRKFEMLSPWMGKTPSSPCLFIIGEDDYMLRLPNVEKYIKSGGLKNEFPNLAGVVFLPGGHFVEEDSPDKVNTHLITFLKKTC